jgi:hypothetical protein
MRITDTERLYGIKAGTWHAWEQWPEHDAFRRPDDDNMKRLFEITGGEITPETFTRSRRGWRSWRKGG